MKHDFFTTAMSFSPKAQMSLGDDWALQEGKRQSLISVHEQHKKFIAQQHELLKWYKNLHSSKALREYSEDDEPHKKKRKEDAN